MAKTHFMQPIFRGIYSPKKRVQFIMLFQDNGREGGRTSRRRNRRPTRGKILRFAYPWIYSKQQQRRKKKMEQNGGQRMAHGWYRYNNNNNNSWQQESVSFNLQFHIFTSQGNNRILNRFAENTRFTGITANGLRKLHEYVWTQELLDRRRPRPGRVPTTRERRE